MRYHIFEKGQTYNGPLYDENNNNDNILVPTEIEIQYFLPSLSLFRPS